MAKVDTKPLSQLNQKVYEDFDPTIEWVQNADNDTLLVYLPGFKRDQLKVQVTSTRKLRLSGERQLADNKWSRFKKEVGILPKYGVDKISAKFEKGILHVQHPKVMISTPHKQQEIAASPTAEKTSEGPRKQTNEPQPKETKQQDVSPKAKEQKAGGDYADKPSDIGKESSNASNSVLQRTTNDNKSTNNEFINNSAAKTKDEKRTSTAANNSVARTEEEATASGDGGSGNGKSKLVYCKEVIGGLMTQMKKPRRSTNMVVAGLLVVAIGMYIERTIRLYVESEN